MNDKLKKARFETLKKMSKDKSGDMFSSKLGDKMKAKRGLSKVTVMADDEEGLKKGLSKAQELLKAKLGEKFGLEDKDEDETEEHDEECPGCDYCSDEEEDEE